MHYSHNTKNNYPKGYHDSIDGILHSGTLVSCSASQPDLETPNLITRSFTTQNRTWLFTFNCISNLPFYPLPDLEPSTLVLNNTRPISPGSPQPLYFTRTWFSDFNCPSNLGLNPLRPFNPAPDLIPILRRGGA